MQPDEDYVFRMPAYVSLEEAARIFAQDLSTLCDAQLARLLVEARQVDPLPIVEALVPLARTELARRRAMNPPVSRSLPEDFPSNRS